MYKIDKQFNIIIFWNYNFAVNYNIMKTNNCKLRITIHYVDKNAWNIEYLRILTF